MSESISRVLDFFFSFSLFSLFGCFGNEKLSSVLWIRVGLFSSLYVVNCDYSISGLVGAGIGEGISNLHRN